MESSLCTGLENLLAEGVAESMVNYVEIHFDKRRGRIEAFIH